MIEKCVVTAKMSSGLREKRQKAANIGQEIRVD